MQSMRKPVLIALALAALVTPAAADYPDRAIRLLVPYPPGGPNDTIARMIGSKLSVSLGQQVVIENRAGAAGNLAMEMTARAAPDGYTAVVPSVSYVTNPTLFKKISYKLDEVTPVSLVAKGPTVLVASPSLGVKTVAELIALAKSKPGTLDYCSGGNGSTSHLSGEMLNQYAGIKIQHIPYKGTNDLISDLLVGRVPLYFMSPLVARQYVSEGKLIALGITAPKRVQGWLDVPTMEETLPGFSVETWHPVVVPKATPQAIIDKLSKHIADAVKSPELTEKLLSLGFEPVGSTPAEAEAFIAAETQRWIAVIKSANVVVE
jgi:tripartite-type tricarboxylate transporter receptor subunit TctC